MKKLLLIAVALPLLCFQCSSDTQLHPDGLTGNEASLESALLNWPEMPQQIAFTGLKDCPTKFQVYWNGALSCFVGRDCFGNVFPPQEAITRMYEKEQLHLTFAGGHMPVFPVIDSGQVDQSLLDGYLPVVTTSWTADRIKYSLQTLATSMEKDELDPEITAKMAMALVQITVKSPSDYKKHEVPVWLNFSGYRTLVPTDKELPEDVFPPYGGELHMQNNTLVDGQDRIRISLIEATEGTMTKFHEEYQLPADPPEELLRSARKGFLKKLLQIRIPCKPGGEAHVVLALPYFPVNPDQVDLNRRNYSNELASVKQYWDHFYQRDALVETPDEFVNNFYKSGLWRTLVTADRDPNSGLIYAKSSPAWYETLWPNCTMVSAVSMMNRGHQDISARYLEPFLEWQSVRDPPNMQDASKEGFLCPPEAYCAIPWVSNNGNILWALCEQYRITGDSMWAKKICHAVLQSADWIVTQRKLTLNNTYGAGLLPGGTVSDDKGSGQYLCSDAQNYRGLRSAADFLTSIGHPRAIEMDLEAKEYREDILKALYKCVERNDTVLLADGTPIPFVPAEINQAEPPAFSSKDFWPYINYIDVGPMHLVDCKVLDSNSELAQAILQFEKAYPVATLDHPISLTENWVHSIKYPGEQPAFLLHHGVSTIEPFYAPRATMYLENDQIEEYINLFYNQLASGVSHKNLAPCENRYGVWQMPWADGEFHKVLLQMLIYQEEDILVLLNAIPRRWLANGKKITVARQPTEFGIIGFIVESHLDEGFIEMNLDLGKMKADQRMHIRFRHPDAIPIRGVFLDGNPFQDFDKEYVYLDGDLEKNTSLKIIYGKK